MAQKPQTLHPLFETTFMRSHAGSIIQDPRYAITELIANAWDAGASEVRITWPENSGEIVITDNGTGMTEEEFSRRWTTLSYNRIQHQGSNVEFPPGVRGNKARKAFGRNGVGRHGMFYFADTYTITTARAGRSITAKVCPSEGRAFQIDIHNRCRATHHGTELRAYAHGPITLSEDDVLKLLGSKFVYEPNFHIHVNGREVRFTELKKDAANFAVNTPFGTALVYRFDSEGGRTSEYSGIAWWVNDRRVGNPTWTIGERALLDARSSAGKRLVYIVKADFLDSSDIKQDWSGFHRSAKIITVEDQIEEAVRSDLHQFFLQTRNERKREAILRNRDQIAPLPLISRAHVAEFIEKVQIESPTISEKDLSSMVRVFAKMEMASTGFDLLERLASLSPEDIDKLDEILSEWSVSDAKVVLNELGKRLKLIERLQTLVDGPGADELHELQPLFERGLWIFGPQFEALSFTSNRTLLNVVRSLLATRYQLNESGLITPRNRPDFIGLPESSIGIYSSDSFDETHEVADVGHVMIVELKRGGFTVGAQEKDQAMSYARELRRTGLRKEVPITCYVLGSNVDPAYTDVQSEGQTFVHARQFGVILKQAHQRTFNLQSRLNQRIPVLEDRDMEDVIAGSLFAT